MNEPLEGLLYRALTSVSGIGIVVESSDPAALRMKLYPVRKAQPLFEPLSFVLSPVNPQHLWILRKPTDDQG